MGLASGAGLLPAQGDLSAAPSRLRLCPVPAAASCVWSFFRLRKPFRARPVETIHPRGHSPKDRVEWNPVRCCVTSLMPCPEGRDPRVWRCFPQGRRPPPRGVWSAETAQNPGDACLARRRPAHPSGAQRCATRCSQSPRSTLLETTPTPHKDGRSVVYASHRTRIERHRPCMRIGVTRLDTAIRHSGTHTHAGVDTDGGPKPQRGPRGGMRTMVSISL